MRLRNIITAIIALTIVAGTAVAQDELPKSLIDRGDFEGTLGGWERGHGAIELDEDTPHDGAGAVRLTDGARLQTPLIPYTEEFVRVALWMRTEGVERGAEAWHQAGGQIAWYDAEKNSMGHSDIGLTVGTTDWTQHETRFFREAKDGVAYISVGLMIWNATGTAWFDDVVVEATEPPEEYIKVPLLEQVENDPPIFWPVPPLQDADQPVDMGPVEVNFTATRDFMIRPADAAAPEVSRVDIKVGGGGNMGYTESGWEAASGWHHRYKYLMEGEDGYPALEVYGEAFRGSPIVSYFTRLYMLENTEIPRFEVAFRVPGEFSQVTYFQGAKPVSGPLVETTPVLAVGYTNKPFIIVHRPDDTAGLVIYHPVPAEVRRWHIEDYIVEAQPNIVMTSFEDGGDYGLQWHFTNIEAGGGGYEHSFDFSLFLMPYIGTARGALKEFQVADADLMDDVTPIDEQMSHGYWAEWMPRLRGARLLRMARYHPREFSSWIHGGTSSHTYGHPDGHMWGGMTGTMKGIRVDPLAENALSRDHAFRMLHFFLERMNEAGAPPDLAMWRALAARLDNPEDYRDHVFCQYWEFRMGEFRRLMQSPQLTEIEKEEAYERLQLAQNLFDPERQGTWTEVIPEGGYWFKYMDLPIWPENQWVINTHATSVGIAGQFALLATETGHDGDAAWWKVIYERGVDGLLYAMGQDWMWYVDDHDPNEVRYGKRGGPRGYHGYMMTAWVPDIIRLGRDLGDYRFDELVAAEKRLMKAKYLEGEPATLQLAQAFLEEIGQGEQ